MRTIERMWPEKVDSDWAIDCSSPMSAKTSRMTGRREPGAAGMCRPDWCISASRPSVRSATVLPPVLGPVMTSARKSVPSRMSIGTTRPVRPGWRAESSSNAIVGSTWSRSHGVQLGREPRAGDPEVEASPGRRASRRAASACCGDERRQLVEDALLFGLGLELRLAPGVAQLDDDERLDEQRLAAARLIVDDALDAALGVGPDRHDVAAVAQGDDRLLQRARDAPPWTSVSSRARSRS